MTNVKYYDSVLQVDESTSLARMRENCPKFFGGKLYKRETYTTHRGCIVLRGTVQYTGCKPRRETVVYLYLPNGSPGSPKPDTFCISSHQHNSVRSARKFIDRVLDNGSVA